MAKLSDFFDRLTSDERFEEDFDDRPRRVMRNFGLDEDQQMLVLAGTAKQIRAALKKELGKDVTVIMVKMR